MKPIAYQGGWLDPAAADDRVTMAEICTAGIRMRNRGMTMPTIARTFAMDEDVLAGMLDTAITRLAQVDAQSVRGRQQAIIHDLYNALYPGLDAFADEDRVKTATAIRGVLEYEGKLTGATAPTRIRVGLDNDTFTTTVKDDLRALGVDPAMDTPLEPEDEQWANT